LPLDAQSIAPAWEQLADFNEFTGSNRKKTNLIEAAQQPRPPGLELARRAEAIPHLHRPARQPGRRADGRNRSPAALVSLVKTRATD